MLKSINYKQNVAKEVFLTELTTEWTAEQLVLQCTEQTVPEAWREPAGGNIVFSCKWRFKSWADIHLPCFVFDFSIFTQYSTKNVHGLHVVFNMVNVWIFMVLD